ncbi:MAG: hypothetical protein WCH34_17360 [Bacteroidota bacterium]
MTRELIIERTLTALTQLPQEKAVEIADFADFILKKYNEVMLQKGIEKLVSDSKSFDFLNNEEELYHLSDLKERYK